MDIERLKHGAAIIRGELGGAKAHPALASLIGALGVCYSSMATAEGWSDDSVLALADVDSALELGEANRRRANEMENRYRAESLRANELDAAAANQADRAEKLQARNDNQAATIQTFEQRHREAMKAAESIVAELDEAREALAEWRKKALRSERHCERFQAVALAVGACPIAELPERVRAAYSDCVKRGAAINVAERIES